MAFRDINGELAVVIGCGTNRLDSAKLVSNVT
ncbi:MAG: hydantoin racemase [Prevotella sp.]|nr:MAG: hydantoin racemase [Prevotella sp.]